MPTIRELSRDRVEIDMPTIALSTGTRLEIRALSSVPSSERLAQILLR
jgi:hypothetical protein